MSFGEKNKAKKGFNWKKLGKRCFFFLKKFFFLRKKLWGKKFGFLGKNFFSGKKVFFSSQEKGFLE